MFNNNCGGGCNDIFLILIMLCCCGNNGSCGNNCGGDCGCDCCPRENDRRCCDCDSGCKKGGCDSCDLLIWILLINCICGGKMGCK